MSTKLDYRRDGNRVVICAPMADGEERFLAEVREPDGDAPAVRFLGARATLQLDTAKRVLDYVLMKPWRSSS